MPRPPRRARLLMTRGEPAWACRDRAVGVRFKLDEIDGDQIGIVHRSRPLGSLRGRRVRTLLSGRPPRAGACPPWGSFEPPWRRVDREEEAAGHSGQVGGAE